jgi:hypothetical protein
MENSTVTPLQSDDLLTTQLELIIPTTVAGTLYGILFTLFCLYAHAMAPRLRDGDTKRQAKFMLMYSMVIMLCGMYLLVANTWATQDAYIKHANYPGGPFVYLNLTFSTPTIAVALACEFVIDILTSAIQVRIYYNLICPTR